uniref:hypothetical protein n=1 Tax=Flavobacterium sp. TaxID=239 RepID=UPI00404B4E8A
MKNILMIILVCILSNKSFGQTKTIHVFVALCDNVNQGIVPVPKALGNGQDPKSNLYWGAAFGIKNYFKNKTTDWNLIKSYPSENPNILERLLFKHATESVYMLAEAYDGAKIKECTLDFLKAANQQNSIVIKHENSILNFGGKSDLVSYIGHDGLMDFNINMDYQPTEKKKIDVIILACFSKKYFTTKIQNANANPILWTTHLMAPEAYTLKSAIDGWILKESGVAIKERAAQTYHKYQKCGIKGARNLFATGF